MNEPLSQPKTKFQDLSAQTKYSTWPTKPKLHLFLLINILMIFQQLQSSRKYPAWELGGLMVGPRRRDFVEWVNYDMDLLACCQKLTDDHSEDYMDLLHEWVKLDVHIFWNH